MSFLTAVAAALAILLPLALAPGWFFYYDITPKACLLWVGAAMAMAGTLANLDRVLAAWNSRAGRWLAASIAVLGAAAVLAALFSPFPQLAWMGANWRRGGALTELAVVVLALTLAAVPRAAILRAICLGGIAAAAYGIAQYFGFDPWIPQAGYVTGEGLFQIVRPPSTLGHADYFAAFLVWPVFAGASLRISGKDRVLAGAAIVIGVVASILAGSRGGWLGMTAGLTALCIVHRPSWRVAVRWTLAGLVVFAAFYASPLGERLRARAFWIGEDRTGGARLLLWRDSLRLAATRPLAGAGLDVFQAVFPQVESRELARAYPDFAQESPHNMFLDAATGEGVPGLAAVASIAGLGVVAAWKTDPGLFAALIGCLVAHQFIVFVPVNEFFFLLGAGLAVARPNRPVQFRAVKAAAALGLILAGGFLWAAHRIGSGDRALLTLQESLAAGDLARSTQTWARTSDAVTADIEISHLAANASARTKQLPEKLAFAQLAGAAAVAATRRAENRANAWYNLAILQAGSNDAAGVEESLRAAIASAPVWYKPHWMLARVLAASGTATGKSAAAKAEAEQALDLDAGKHPEVTQTSQDILRSATPAK